MAQRQHNINRLINQLDDEMPIYQVMEVITGIKKLKVVDPKQERIGQIITGATLTGMVLASGLLLQLIHRKRQLEARITRLLVQEPLDVGSVEHVVFRWQNEMDTSYKSIDVMKDQWDGVNRLREVFVTGRAHPSKQLVIGSVDVYEPLASIQMGSNISTRHTTFTTQDTLIQDALLGPTPRQPLKHVKMHGVLPVTNLVHQPPQLPTSNWGKFNLFILALINRVRISFGSTPFFDGPDLKVGRGKLVVYPGMSLCVFTDLIVKEGSTRLYNPKWIGSSFKEVSMAMLDHSMGKLESVKFKLACAAFIGVGLVVFYLSRQIHQSILRDWTIAMEMKYPRIQEVKQPPNTVYVQTLQGKDPLVCHLCSQNNIDFIFVPCFHFQVCQICFHKAKEILECLTCKKTVYCGIPIHFA